MLTYPDFYNLKGLKLTLLKLRSVFFILYCMIPGYFNSPKPLFKSQLPGSIQENMDEHPV